MKPLCDIKYGVRLLDAERQLWGLAGADDSGIFAFLMSGEEAHVIASCGDEWDHVSVSFQHRTPSWAEMEHIKRLFFHPHETAMQLHVPPKHHINCNPNVLHMWRPHNAAIPMPPKEMV